MFSGLQQRIVVLLLIAAGVFISRPAHAAGIDTTRPAQTGVSLLLADVPDETQFNVPGAQGDSTTIQSAAPSTQPSATEQPAQPQVINDPLPPAFWPGVCMLALAGTLLSVRKLHRLLR